MLHKIVSLCSAGPAVELFNCIASSGMVNLPCSAGAAAKLSPNASNPAAHLELFSALEDEHINDPRILHVLELEELLLDDCPDFSDRYQLLQPHGPVDEWDASADF
eukprot:GHUV01009077.1.p2 GENE.GHUV01009077.1~~GHUV01009077.1.p2  ORF type:complete len:106 (-),score=11.82 GHUV01009077.1:330-647(-)